MGFTIIGRQPEAFAHPTHGLADAYLMHMSLESVHGWSGISQDIHPFNTIEKEARCCQPETLSNA
ncbi:hypothetical protein [Abyssibacter sp.]|uniref:hypothetical protein n=1 Tax=Abyssibacter sp. TaxID=2320200 RepID=UPI000C6A4BB4|nr:hypothetical protein [Abyssibacter sp.]MBB87250.1 hypothetical protein [Xanthomonadales bacterium]MCK5857814.1 hypothetical protein [Abyssibacter sp.]